MKTWLVKHTNCLTSYDVNQIPSLWSCPLQALESKLCYDVKFMHDLLHTTSIIWPDIKQLGFLGYINKNRLLWLQWL